MLLCQMSPRLLLCGGGPGHPGPVREGPYAGVDAADKHTSST